MRVFNSPAGGNALRVERREQQLWTRIKLEKGPREIRDQTIQLAPRSTEATLKGDQPLFCLNRLASFPLPEDKRSEIMLNSERGYLKVPVGTVKAKPSTRL